MNNYWDSREIYHFEKYNMKLNDDFIIMYRKITSLIETNGGIFML